MVATLDGVMAGKRRDSFGGVESKKHDTLEAQRLLADGMKKFRLKPKDLLILKTKRMISEKKQLHGLFRSHVIF